MGAVGAVWGALPAVTPWGRRKQAAETWFEAQAEAGNHRQTIDHLKRVLTNQRDPRDIALTERYIAQHLGQLAALRREADLRANESQKQTEKRHETERKAAEAAERYRRDNPPSPSPEELERRRQDELLRRERIEKAEKLERLTHDVRLMIEQKAPRAWAKAQEEHPGDHAEAVKAARRVIRREVSLAVGSRVWPGPVDEVFERVVREAFTVPKPSSEAAPELSPAPQRQEPQPAPSPRPKGPRFDM